jgi:hypothetical protein
MGKMKPQLFYNIVSGAANKSWALRLLCGFLLLASFSTAQAQQGGTYSNPTGGNLSVQDAGTCSTNASFIWQHLPFNASTTSVNLAGTFSATVTVRESNNGGTTWTTAGTQSSAGTTTYSTSGFTDICADVTTFTSGVVLVSLSTSIQQVQSVVSSTSGSSTPVGNPVNSIDATSPKYGLKYDAHWVYDATTTTGANPTITCSTGNDCNFTSTDLLGRPIAKTGQIVFGVCGPINFNNGPNATLDVAQTTITTINGAQSITVGGTGTTACAGNLVLVWGDDDSAALTSFWNDVTSFTSHCGRGLLPPGSMLVQSGQFNTAGNGSCSSAAAIAAGAGVALTGAGIDSTFIIPTPNFSLTTGSGNSCSGIGPNSTTVPTANANNVCFFGSPGMELSNLQVWGAGNPLTGTNPASATYLAGIAGGTSNSYASVSNVRVGNWGTNGGANLDGFAFWNITYGSNGIFQSDNFGNTGVVFASLVGGPNFGTNLSINGGSFMGDNGAIGSTQNVLIVNASISSTGNNFGYCFTNPCINVNVNQGRFYSQGDFFQGGGTTGGGAILVQQGLVDLANGQVNTQTSSGTTASYGIFAETSSTVHLAHSQVKGGTQTALSFDATSIYYDDCGNQFTAGTNGIYSITAGAKVFGNCSVIGTVPATGNFTLTNATFTSVSGQDQKHFTLNITASAAAAITIVYTFPTAFAIAPGSCHAQDVGGTNPVLTFTTSVAATTTAVTFLSTAAATNTDTLTVAIDCQ